MNNKSIALSRAVSIIPNKDCCTFCAQCYPKPESCCIFQKNRLGFSLDCSACISIEDCYTLQTGGENSLCSFEVSNEFAVRVSVPSPRFPEPFIAKIDIGPKLTPQQIKIIQKAEMEWIAISLGDLLSEKKPLELILKPRYQGHTLQEITGFPGLHLLTLNIRDEYCDLMLKNREKLIRIILQLAPDASTTADANFYFTLPHAILRKQFERVCRVNLRMLDLGIPLVGLVPPHLDLVDEALKFFHKVGIDTIALPMLELNKYRNRDPLYRWYAKELTQFLGRHPLRRSFRTMGLSTSPFNYLKLDYFSSKSWAFIKEGSIYNPEEKQEKQYEKLRRTNQRAKIQAYRNLQQRKQCYFSQTGGLI